MFGRERRERVAGKATLSAARGAGKAARGAGKLAKGGARSGTTRKAAHGASKAALKGGSKVLSPGASAGPRYLRYGFFALVGFAVGALVARSSSREDASTFTGTTGQHTPDLDSPAGRRGETWGSGTPTGAAGGTAGAGSGPARPEALPRPGGPNPTRPGRDQDPERVVSGKGVGLGGGRIIKKKKKSTTCLS